jgi:hypothetical protein
MLAVSKTHEQVVLDASHPLQIDQEAHALAAKSSPPRSWTTTRPASAET